MTPFEVGIWQAAYAHSGDGLVADGSVLEFRDAVANGVKMLPVTEGNVCDHKGKPTFEDKYRGLCCDCGVPMGSL